MARLLAALLAALAATVLAPATAAAGAPDPAVAPGPFSSLAELDAALADLAAGGDADAFWARVEAGAVPLIFGETAVFLYRGDARRVEWRGGFSSWDGEGAAVGRRIGDTDVWEWRDTFPPAARVDYKIVVDGGTWLVDPRNPHQQVGGYGPNSELRMPGWSEPLHTRRRDEVPRGDLGDDRWIDSEVLGYEVRYRVWSPPGATASPPGLPVLYVTDGSDYWRDEMGSLVITLDNLTAAGDIAPLHVVFVDPWDRERSKNRRGEQYAPGEDGACPFCRFLAEELVPAVDAALPTRATAAGRALLGTSLGGLFAVEMGLRYPDLFGHLGVQSPAPGRPPGVQIPRIAAAESYPGQVFLSAGTFEPAFLDQARGLRDALEARGADVRLLEVPEDHSWGAWRAQLDDLLRFFFPPEKADPERP